jgi:hypothetical protein
MKRYRILKDLELIAQIWGKTTGAKRKAERFAVLLPGEQETDD